MEISAVTSSPGLADKSNSRLWRGSTDGTPWMHRALIGLFRFVPLRLMYVVMATAIPVYVVVDSRGRRASYNFFRHRIGYGRLRSALHVLKNMYCMGQVVMDRFASYAGRCFGMQGPGIELYDKLSRGAEGFLLCSSHLGNFELAGYLLRPRKPMKVLVYEGETATVMQNRARLFGEGNVTMVPVREDLSHIFILNSALSDGEIVSVPSDRVYGSAKVVKARFFGQEASFPSGAFTMALQRGVPVVSCFVMKVSAREYRVLMDRLPIPEEGSRNDRLQALAQSFADSLERVAREYPDQWYNFYDFWA